MLFAFLVFSFLFFKSFGFSYFKWMNGACTKRKTRQKFTTDSTARIQKHYVLPSARRGNCEIEKKQRSKRGKLIEEFAVRIGIEQLGTHLGQHLTSDHLQAIFECVVDSNTSVECTKLNSTASAITENTIKYFFFRMNKFKCYVSAGRKFSVAMVMWHGLCIASVYFAIASGSTLCTSSKSTSRQRIVTLGSIIWKKK